MKPLNIIVLDATGSMNEHKSATISGFNEYVSAIASADPEVQIGLVTFNSRRIDTTPPQNAGSFPRLSDTTYVCDHTTPLYDAIMEAVAFAKSHKAKGQAVIMAILTDGEENASRRATREQVKAELEKRQGKGWTIVYLGANQDAWQVGASIGVRHETVRSFDQRLTGQTFSGTAKAVNTLMADPNRRPENFWDGVDSFKED